MPFAGRLPAADAVERADLSAGQGRFIRGFLAYRSVKVYFINYARSCAPEADRESSL
jgi:hypothetical protein